MAALGGEADADKLVTGASDAPPQSAIATTECVIAFARHGFPDTNATFGAAYFQRVGLMLGRFRAPVEAVAAEIHQPPAAAEEILERLHHALGVVLRMLCGDDDTIGRQRGDALGMQVVIGDDVMRHANACSGIGR